MKRLFLATFAVLCVMVASAQVKYVFYMIGDGMGPNQVLATEMYLAELDGYIGRKQLCMTTFPFSGQLGTFSASNGITDSSAAGTCLASGKKTTNHTLGLDANGEPVKTVAEILHNGDWAVGIMTSVSIDHATPGAFYAHVKSRSDYYTIGLQLAKSDFDFFGGATFYQPYNKKSPQDGPNVYAACEEAGYRFAHGYKEYKELADADKLILIQQHEGLKKDYLGEGLLPYAIDKKPEDLTLPQITEAAIDFLSRKDKPFFMMVEGGAIDWACHSNDAATVIGEVLEFDEAIRVAYDFYLKHPKETLIIVTADHETGGMALGNSDYTLNLKALQNQKESLDQLSDQIKELHQTYGKKLKWQQVKDLLQGQLGLYDVVEVTKEEDAELQATFKKMLANKATDEKSLYSSVSALSKQAVRLLNKKAKVGWTTGSHSAAAVPVFAIGQGAELFTGWHDNSEIAPLILKLTSK